MKLVHNTVQDVAKDALLWEDCVPAARTGRHRASRHDAANDRRRRRRQLLGDFLQPTRSSALHMADTLRRKHRAPDAGSVCYFGHGRDAVFDHRGQRRCTNPLCGRSSATTAPSTARRLSDAQRHAAQRARRLLMSLRMGPGQARSRGHRQFFSKVWSTNRRDALRFGTPSGRAGRVCASRWIAWSPCPPRRIRWIRGPYAPGAVASRRGARHARRTTSAG